MITQLPDGFLLENDYFSRKLMLDKDGLRTVSVVNKQSGSELWVDDDVADFELQINGRKISSRSGEEIRILDGNVEKKQNNLAFQNHKLEAKADGREILELTFSVVSDDAELTACYEVHPDLPGTVKYLKINAGAKELALNLLTIERFRICPGEFNQIEYYKEHGTQRINCQNFVLSGSDDVLQMHNPEMNEGLFIGNGAPPPLRNFLVYPHWGWGISCGYNMGPAEFNKYLNPGEGFITDRIYLTLYQGGRNCQKAAHNMREMIRRDLPVIENEDTGVMYCTWLPFLKNINSELLLDLAERAANLGFTSFVVDDGWFADDFQVDKEKFPNGLEEIADRVHQLGLKFGLWFNIGTDYGVEGSKPEDNTIKSDGSAKGVAGKCRCFASAHRDFIAQKLVELAENYKVDYFKLDFSTICSPYGMIPIGCQSTSHAYHRSGADAVVEQYASMEYIRKQVKQQFPKLVVDFSFEVFGAERPSIAALRFSELHHSSNMNTLRPQFLTPFNIRNTLYSYCGQLPAERILGSLICLQDNNDIESLLSAMIGTPLVAGDLRKISQDNNDHIREIANTVNRINETGIMTNLEILHNANQPLDINSWDGYCRYNQKGHGILAAFAPKYGYCQDGMKIEFKLQLLPESVTSFKLIDFLNETEVGVFSRDELINGIELHMFQQQSYGVLLLDPA